MTEENTERAWYLVYTKPRSEKLAKENLTRQGYEVYLPHIEQTRKKGLRYVKLVEPLFPRYLFIKLSHCNDNWAPIRSTRGVANIVSFAYSPAIVPAVLIDRLCINEDDKGLQIVPSMGLEEGDSVEIISGPLTGYEGIFVTRNAKDRVTILLDIVGQQSKLEINPIQIQTKKKIQLLTED